MMKDKALKPFIVAICIIFVLALPLLMSPGLRGRQIPPKKLFDLASEDIELIEIASYGQFKQPDEEACREIIKILNNAKSDSEIDKSMFEGGCEYIISIKYTSGEEVNYFVNSSQIKIDGMWYFVEKGYFKYITDLADEICNV